MDELEAQESLDEIDQIDLDIDNNTTESQESSNNIELKEILDKIDNVETIPEKVNLFIQAFKLFYDVLDEETLTEEMTQCCRDNREVLNGIQSILDMLSK